MDSNLPVNVKTDNICDMFMAQNASSCIRICYVNTVDHFVTENIEEGMIRIEFVKSIEKESVIFTDQMNKEINKRLMMMGLKRCNGGKETKLFGIGRILEKHPYIRKFMIV
jgi:hypothetical protein